MDNNTMYIIAIIATSFILFKIFNYYFPRNNNKQLYLGVVTELYPNLKNLDDKIKQLSIDKNILLSKNSNNNNHYFIVGNRMFDKSECHCYYVNTTINENSFFLSKSDNVHYQVKLLSNPLQYNFKTMFETAITENLIDLS